MYKKLKPKVLSLFGTALLLSVLFVSVANPSFSITKPASAQLGEDIQQAQIEDGTAVEEQPLDQVISSLSAEEKSDIEEQIQQVATSLSSDILSGQVETADDGGTGPQEFRICLQRDPPREGDCIRWIDIEIKITIGGK